MGIHYTWNFVLLYWNYYIGGIFVGIYLEIAPTITMYLMPLPFGILSCWLTYRILKNNWEEEKNRIENSLETKTNKTIIDEVNSKDI